MADSGPDWVERFNRLYEKLKPKILSDSDRLPRWLRAKKDYDIWQRSNLWILHNALSISQDHLTLDCSVERRPGRRSGRDGRHGRPGAKARRDIYSS